LLVVSRRPFCVSSPHNDSLVLLNKHTQVPASLNDTQRNLYAEFGSEVRRSVCPYFARKAFQCQKLFPPCVRDASTDSEVVTLICKATCLKARTWDCERCKDYDLSTECDDVEIYTEAAGCDADTQARPDSSSCDDDDNVGWIIGGVAIGVGVALLAWYLKNLLNDRGVGVDKAAAEREDMNVERVVAKSEYKDGVNDGSGSDRKRGDLLRKAQAGEDAQHKHHGKNAVQPAPAPAATASASAALSAAPAATSSQLELDTLDANGGKPAATSSQLELDTLDANGGNAAEEVRLVVGPQSDE
jgi:hypothetical protein